jgi:hypothetical protein
MLIMPTFCAWKNAAYEIACDPKGGRYAAMF